MTSGPPIALNGLTKRYGTFTAVDDVSLAVQAGSICGLLGPNGAGKTTCFYSIMGLVKPDSGRILLDGADITGLPMYRRAVLGLGYLPQETSIFRGMTVAENIMSVLELAEPDRETRFARQDELLGEFRLDGLRDSMATALSGGERRRCEIARALAANPSIMLLDEPFAGINPRLQNRIVDHLEALRQQGLTVFFIDHEMRIVLSACDVVHVLAEGQVIASGAADTIRDNPRVQDAYF